MDDKAFKCELERVKFARKASDGDRLCWWDGYYLGLNRGHFGDEFECAHDALMSISADEPDTAFRAKGAGYREGYEVGCGRKAPSDSL